MTANAGSTTAPRDDRDPGVPPSLTEHVVLAVLGEGPAHGFAIARELSAGLVAIEQVTA